MQHVAGRQSSKPEPSFERSSAAVCKKGDPNFHMQPKCLGTCPEAHNVVAMVLEGLACDGADSA